MAAENALSVQSDDHPDGWGVAFYVDGAPHITRSPATAGADRLFHRLSGVVASETVLAHVRKATVGNISVLNCHPFQYGRWAFAHNGEIPNFDACRERVLDELPGKLRKFILGDTDSEVIFFLFLSLLSQRRPISNTFAAGEVASALAETVHKVHELCSDAAAAVDKPLLLTLMVTDGQTMAAIQGGKELYYSTYKTRCSDRDSCPHLGPSCEAPSQDGVVNHLVLSSEPIGGDNVWCELEQGEVIGIDHAMRVQRQHASRRYLPTQ